MKYRCLLLFLVLLFVWSCQANKRRKHNKKSSEIRRSNSRSRNESGGNSPASPRESEENARASQTETNQRKRKNRKQRNRSGSDDELDTGSRGSQRVLEERRKEVLRSTMRHMFGFDHMDAPRISQDTTIDVENMEGRKLSHSHKAATRHLLNTLQQESVSRQRFLPDPPDFMLELYRTYSEDKTQTLINSISQGNTVRSFYSVAGESPGRPQDKGKPMIILPYNADQRSITNNAESARNQIRVFAFNVTAIPATESIVGAELRLNGLRNLAMQNRGSGLATNHSDAGWTAVLAVYQVSSEQTQRNGTRNVYQRLGDFITIRPNSSFSWVDKNIAALATRSRESGRILIVKFDDGSESELMRRKRSALGSIPNYSTMRSQSASLELPSFFVVMSDRSKRNSGDHQRARTHTISLSPILIVYCNDTSAEIAPTSTPQISNEDELLRTLAKFNVSSKHRRFRRSTGQRSRDDTLLPPSDEDNNEFPGESPRSGSDSRLIQDNDQTELRDNRKSERRVIQSLKDRNTMSQKRKNKKRKRKCRKRGRKGKKSRKCRDNKPTTAAKSPLNKAQHVCSRKSLHVDFGDMGWADWIISPKSFDAYYCSGVCEFDTMKKASPSNHAIIQAFIKAFEINADVPSPCCVPEKLMSLSVLFFDKDDNVVLKVFPNMSVESCACR